MELREALKSVGASPLSLTPGDVCLVEDEAVVIPETPADRRKMHDNGRICIVLSNRKTCRITTYPILLIAPVSHRVDLKGEQDFTLKPTPETGLHVSSMAMLGHIQPVRKTDIFKKIGCLSADIWEAMLAHILSNMEP